jgi:hypothetical protein
VKSEKGEVSGGAFVLSLVPIPQHLVVWLVSQHPLDSAMTELRFFLFFVQLGEQAPLGVWFVVKSRGKALCPVVDCALMGHA